MNNQIHDIKNSLDIFFKKADDDTRIPMINFLYGGKDKLQEKKIVVSDKLIRTKEEDSIINEYSLEIPLTLDKTKRTLDLFVTKWGNITKRIHTQYGNYINNLSKNRLIKYLIVSEAPLLDISMPPNFKCKYIFGSDSECTIYRSTPFHAFNKLKNENYSDTTTTRIKKIDFFKCMKDDKVAFMDLVPLPLPLIPTEVRRDWSFNEDFRIENGYPLSFSLFLMAFERFKIKFKECHKKTPKFNKKLKIIFMMPPKTSMGIIDYLAADVENRKKTYRWNYKIT